MTVLIKKITGMWRETGIIEKADEDVYEYGLDLLLYSILNIVVILGSAAFIGKLTESLALLAGIMPLQSFGGGYHAKTHLRCFLIMYIGWWAVVFVLPFISSDAVFIMICASVLIVFRVAPVAHENVKMSDIQKKRMRKLVRVVVVIGVLMSAFFVWGAYARIGVAISTGVGIASLSMLIAHGKNMISGIRT